MKQSVQIGNINVAPGEVKLGKLSCGYLPDSSEVSIPLIVVNGAKEGPTLLLTGAMHGPEVPGCEVIRRITREIVKPEELRGSIIAAPVLNPFGFNMHSMNTPQDGYNLNRVFPGEADSLLSHRLAHLIFNELVMRSDHIIDFHANPQPAMQFTIVKHGANQDVNVFNKTMALAEAYGITIIEMITSFESHRTGTLAECAADKGKSCIILELVSWRRQEEHSVQSGVKGTLNVMKHLDMIDGKIEPQDDVLKFEGRLTRTELTANKGGFVHYLKEIGQWVKKGELIALIRDPWGDVAEEIYAPLDCWILAWPLIYSQTVATGDLLVMLAFPKA